MTPNRPSTSAQLSEPVLLRSTPMQQHTPLHPQQHTPPHPQQFLPAKNGCNNENCNRLFVVVGQLQETVADLTDIVKRLDRKMDNQFIGNNKENEDEKSYEILGKIPVQSLEEMEEFEKMLENPQSKKQLFKVLTSVGGKDIKTMTYNCLRRLMAYHVGVEYSYSGNIARNKKKTKKMPFSKTNCCKIAHQAVKKMNPAATEEMVKTLMGKWLQQAKYRLGRKSSEVGGGDEVREEVGEVEGEEEI